MTDQRERMIRRVSRSLAWASYGRINHDDFRQKAVAIVDDLLAASAEGKAVERALRVIEKRTA